MNQRVNIQYSVNIDDLGDEVSRLMCDAFEKLNKVNDDAVAPTSDVLSLQIIQKIDKIRHDLSDVDIKLSDAINIINGYVAYKSDLISQQSIGALADKQVEEHEAQSPDLSSVTDSMTDSLSNLQEQLMQFQNEDEVSAQG